jgi:hypothetical protein
MAAICGKISIVEWLLAEGGAHISVVSNGDTTLLAAARFRLPDVLFESVQWLIEHGGADIKERALTARRCGICSGQLLWEVLP